MADAAWFAGRLRELRENAGLSRQELADKAGLSIFAVRNIEQGTRIPNWETALAIADAIGVSCEAFRQPPAEREAAGPGRPPKGKEEAKPEQPKRRKKK